MKHSQSRAELVLILKTGKHQQIEWADAESIAAQQPELTQAQIAAIVAAQDKRCTNELINVEASRVAALRDGQDFTRDTDGRPHI